MSNETNTTDNQEINLTHISQKAKGYFSRLNDSFFDGILFLKRNIIIVAILVIIGVAYGFYKDNQDHRYQHKVFLIPNFSSTDYLYKEIENLNSKIYDDSFVEKTKINKGKKLVSFKLEPVLDVYGFVDNPEKDKDENDRTYYLIKLMSENSDLSKILENEMTSRNFKKHLLTITTKDKLSAEQDIKPILDYLNADPYYAKMREEGIKNLDAKIAANEIMINQINGILDSTASNPGKSANNMYVDNTNVFELVKLKEKLVREQGRSNIDKLNFTKTIKDSSMTLNMDKVGFTTGKMKFIIPIILLLVFVALVRFKNYYKNQVDKRKKAVTN
ncbi:hypothetical protein D3C87_171020 [compost metagenome]